MKICKKGLFSLKSVISILVIMTMVLMPLSAMGKTDDNGNVVIVFAIDYNQYSVNGELLTMDVSPTIVESRTLLPIRYAAEPLGADVDWDPKEKKATVSLENTVIELWIGDSKSLVNGKMVPIDPDNSNVKPIIIKGRTMLPLRFVAETLGCDVQWDPVDKRVAIIKMASSSDAVNIPDILKNPDFIKDIINNLDKSKDIVLPGKSQKPDVKIPDINKVPELNESETDKAPDLQWQKPGLPGLSSKEDVLKINDSAYYENLYGTILTTDAALLTSPGGTYEWGITNDKSMTLQYYAFYLNPGGKYEKFKGSFYLDTGAKSDLVINVKKNKKDGMVIKSLTIKPGETLKDIEIDISGVDKLYFESELKINHGKVNKILVGEPVFSKTK
ncbi:MAG: copper amine oxidase N-terminal domain-containing protein [Anaerovoracaceae bacterium]|jgi:hypothetical protein